MKKIIAVVLVGLLPFRLKFHGLPKEIFKIGKYHLDISGKGYSMETATTIGAVPAVLRTLID